MVDSACICSVRANSGLELTSPMVSFVFLVEFLTVVFERSMIPAFKCLEAFPS